MIYESGLGGCWRQAAGLASSPGSVPVRPCIHPGRDIGEPPGMGLPIPLPEVWGGRACVTSPTPIPQEPLWHLASFRAPAANKQPLERGLWRRWGN